MPGPGGGINSGGFAGGSFVGSDGTSYVVPEFNFFTITDIFVEIHNTVSNFWVFLNKPFYTALSDIIVGDGEGLLSGLFSFILDAISFTGFSDFLNRFTTLQFIFGSGFFIVLSYRILKFFKP